MGAIFESLERLLRSTAFEHGSLGALQVHDVAGDVVRAIPVPDTAGRMAPELPSSLVAVIREAVGNSGAWLRHVHEGVWAPALGAVFPSHTVYGVSWQVGPGDMPILASLGCDLLPPVSDPFGELPMTFRCSDALLLGTKCRCGEAAWLQAWRGLWSWGSVFIVLAEGREHELRELCTTASVDVGAAQALCRASAAVVVPRFDLDGAWLVGFEGEDALSLAARFESRRCDMSARFAAQDQAE